MAILSVFFFLFSTKVERSKVTYTYLEQGVDGDGLAIVTEAVEEDLRRARGDETGRRRRRFGGSLRSRVDGADGGERRRQGGRGGLFGEFEEGVQQPSQGHSLFHNFGFLEEGGGEIGCFVF